MGEFDFVKTAFADLGGRTEFWKVAVKPGKPLVFGRLGPKLFLGLPGNPVSALVGMTLFGIPALRRMAGARDPLPDLRDARLDAPIENRGDRIARIKPYLIEIKRRCGRARTRPPGNAPQ